MHMAALDSLQDMANKFASRLISVFVERTKVYNKSHLFIIAKNIVKRTLLYLQSLPVLQY